MEQLYKEMQERLRYLEAQEQTEEIKWRIEEITLAIVRVQQLLLANVSGSLHSESDTSKEICKYTCPKCGKGNNDTILAAIHKHYCR